MKMLKLENTYLNLDHVRMFKDTSPDGRVRIEVIFVGGGYKIFHYEDAEIIRKWIQEQPSG